MSLPITVHLEGSLRVTDVGTGSAAASSASAPKLSRFAPLTTQPCSTRHESGLTLQRFAAASTSSMRAAAPAWR